MQTPCKPWTGVILSSGYGQKRANGRRYKAHRWVWEQANGPIPAGMVIMHLCDNPPCVEITHLRLGTQSDNMQDSLAKGRNGFQKRTHCPRGHLYDEANTYYRSTRPTQRLCRTCKREKSRERSRRIRRQQLLTRLRDGIMRVAEGKEPQT